jgi:DNA ligase-associated metallophosphoesterase
MRNKGEPDDGAASLTAPPTKQAGSARLTIAFAGLTMIFDAARVVYLPDHSTLIVSDLHLEKGSRRQGRFIPPFDSHDTLQRLAACIGHYRPRRVICLGDSFDDPRAGERMAAPDRQALNGLCASVEEWVWISGNHDPETPGFCPGSRLDWLRIGEVLFAHQPEAKLESPQIVGHFHPKTSISTGTYRFSGPCFCLSERLLILPAFGAYTSGLSCADPAISSLHQGAVRIYMAHASKLWRLS